MPYVCSYFNFIANSFTKANKTQNENTYRVFAQLTYNDILFYVALCDVDRFSYLVRMRIQTEIIKTKKILITFESTLN